MLLHVVHVSLWERPELIWLYRPNAAYWPIAAHNVVLQVHGAQAAADAGCCRGHDLHADTFPPIW